MERERRTKIPQASEFLPLAFALLMVLLIGILAYRAGTAFSRSYDQAVVTGQVVQETNALLSSLKDAETAQRGFLLTDDDRYLAPYTEALTQVPQDLDKLVQIEAARNRPDQAQRVEKLQLLVKDKFAELKKTIELRRTQGIEAALAIVRTGQGKAIMDQIRVVCLDIERTSFDLATQQLEQARFSGNETALIAVLGSAAVFILLVLATITIQRGTLRRQQLIAQLRNREAQLTESRDWLQTTLGSIGDAVITTDASGKITLLNAVAQSLTGWTQEEAAGKPLDEVFVIRNAKTGITVENPVSKVLREGRIVGLANHTRLTSKDGRQIPIDDSAAPIRAGEQIAGVVLVFRDVTARVEAEERQALMLAALSRANEDLNQFAFAVSHDLQEPLRMITAYSQLLLKGHRGDHDGEGVTYVQFIVEGSKRMSELMADLLEYTRLTGDGQERSDPVDLNHVFRTAVENCRAAIVDSGATVTSDQLPTIEGHESHFVQLFQNLISNGLKYRRENPPRIHVSAEYQNGTWRVAVADNGIGIDPDYHQTVFGMFKRLHSQDIPGTGIGLAICQRVVERHGGRIWVESKRGQGATFYFNLPAARGATHNG